MNIYKPALVVLISLLFTQSIHAFNRGQEAYVCIKVPAAQCLLQWGFGCGYESCRVRVLEDTGNNIHIRFETSCGMGWNSGDEKWMDDTQVFHSWKACKNLD